MKNSNPDVFEYYLKMIKQFEPDDIIHSCILADNITIIKLKLLLEKSDLTFDDYFMLLRIFGS